MAKKDKKDKTAGKRQQPPPALRELLRIPEGEPVDLSSYDSRATPGGPADKAAALAAVPPLAQRLAGLQERLYAASTAGGRHRVLLILQGMDTSGKGGTIKHVIGHFNPAGCRIRAFKTPTPEERSHPFLWRVRRALPEPGELGIFDRSQYEDVLIARVRELVPRRDLGRRYGQINRFEQSLADNGVTIVKVFLHLGRDEQHDRLLARLDNPDKHWKFSPSDIEDRALWPAYQEAYELALHRCSTAAAPWYLVPADRKWYRNWAISTLLLEHLEALDPEYPEAGFDVEESRRQLLATG
ncbi:UDP-galactose-lipid carrier transferase [Streptomyces sp. L-9-10]|uniref:PPK2 family polyphosphate kinase n=1 Tax=Streptomyces sp. L-9-10 TaxID=1478131 RepID=UPI00101BD6F2|nr:PPK2 family polyphosphate kinase [Streptomyces sp. L-9-10]RYJ28377.1 UDP-galactose-lipid carrier transferase [Streptomyces sp. L-9-10]